MGVDAETGALPDAGGGACERLEEGATGGGCCDGTTEGDVF
jgi:hypothetical protein